MFESILRTDTQLFLWMNQGGSATWDWMWLGFSNTLYAVPLYLGILYLVYRKLGLRKLGLFLVTVGILVLCVDQLANFFKYGTGRLRPCHEEALIGKMRLVKAYCGGKFSFFSAHAANNFAVFTLAINTLLDRGNRWIKILWIWPVFVSLSRVMIGVHYPLDILTGSLVGLFFGWVSYRIGKRYL